MGQFYITLVSIIVTSSSLCSAQMIEEVEHILILKNIYDQNQKLLVYFEGQQEKMASLEVKMESVDSKLDFLEEGQRTIEETLRGQQEKMASLEDKMDSVDNKLDLLEEHSLENQLCSKQDQLEDFKNMYESGKQDIVTSLEKSSCREQILDLHDLLATDECEMLTHNCSQVASCKDQQILYSCVCLPGYSGDGFTCTDVDECTGSDTKCGAKENCTNSPGTYECQCLEGYESGDGGCQDVDECTGSDIKCGANEKCTNSPGTYECQCLEGYEGGDGGCQDVDECQRGQHQCPSSSTCVNIGGSFECQCTPPYQYNGQSCEIDCKSPSLYIKDLGCVVPLLTPTTWSEAKVQCETMHMKLLEDIKKEHIGLISRHFVPLNTFGGQDDLWIGFKNTLWLTSGQPVSDELVASGEGIMEGDCGVLDIEGRHIGLWDLDCNSKYYGLCQPIE